jgi:hypothetical protein
VRQRVREAWIAPAAVAIVISVLVVPRAFDDNGGGSDPVRRVPALEGGGKPAPMDPALESLAVFRRERTAADALPPGSAKRVAASGAGLPGENVRLARRAETRAGSVFLWPAGRRVCFAFRGAGSCDLIERIERRPALAIYRGPGLPRGSTRVGGVAADGVKAVEFLGARGQIQRLPVDENAFLGRIRGRPSKLRWTTDGSTVEVGVPALFFAR